MAKGKLKTQYNKISPIFVSNKVKSPNLKTVENNKNKGNKKPWIRIEETKENEWTFINEDC